MTANLLRKINTKPAVSSKCKEGYHSLCLKLNCICGCGHGGTDLKKAPPKAA